MISILIMLFLLIVLILILLGEYSSRNTIHNYAKEGKLKDLEMRIKSNPNDINSKDVVSM